MDDKLRDNFSPPSSLSTTDTSINDSLNVDMLDDHIDNHRAHRLSIESTNSKSNKQFLKYISLVTLTIQNASLTLFMRAAKTQKESFISSTAVIMAELLKLLTCIFMVYRDEGKCLRKTFVVIKKIVINQPMDTLKVAVPAIVYYVQNNLIYVAATHLDPATSQVTYQLKILTTALFSVFILNKKLVIFQWFSLILLFIGVACVQLTQSKPINQSQSPHKQNILIGFMAILTACVLSGFAGVYFEKILKNSSNISLWIRNIQLSAIAIPFGLIQVFITDLETIRESGFFHGYTILTWTVIFLSAQGGLLVAVVVKYADNILKGFATSISIIISCIVSIYVFDFIVTFQFLIGASLVISSVFLYNKPDMISSESANRMMKMFSATRR
ncbi:UDP-N-acetylglucosamine transporter [Dermatophagoides farinae]|uniref:Udp-galactose translocator-like protein n=1 Tax=Dermatophagoides farinae TaxID=6954 RepID=A0A9D4SLX3_DERFA|nr:UDP-N-acetylglucosamine transporter-like [Dermatophagoides farinae]KAH7646341.1 udp-galactose translocator-like protein [Dermatophagoides farinae]